MAALKDTEFEAFIPKLEAELKSMLSILLLLTDFSRLDC